MTFLELCQRVRQESGISGSGPTTVVNQQAILAKVVEWVRQADLDIQRLHPDWTFLWRFTTASLQSDVRQYTNLDLGLDTFSRVKRISIDGYDLTELDWELFRRRGYVSASDRQRPTTYSFRTDGVLMVYPTPDAAYSLEIDYSLPAKPMLDDIDVSVIPEPYHDIILHKALMYYASHEEDKMLLQVATQRYESTLSELGADCLPKISFLRRGFI